MQISDLQQLLAASTYYKGAVDGDAGPKTWAAIEVIERTSRARYQTNPKRWSAKRRQVGAGQAVLDAMQYEPGAVDGYFGHNTQNALASFLREKATGSPEVVERKVVVSDAPTSIPLQRDRTRVYGAAGGTQCTAGRVRLPYAMALSWNRRKKINSFAFHEAVADNLTAAFGDIFEHYGIEAIKALGLDLWGGAYNYRKVRGGRSLSSHAWGIAVDLNPDKNRLRWRADRASFAAPECEALMQIMESHGFANGGKLWGKDFMHFQAAR